MSKIDFLPAAVITVIMAAASVFVASGCEQSTAPPAAPSEPAVTPPEPATLPPDQSEPEAGTTRSMIREPGETAPREVELSIATWMEIQNKLEKYRTATIGEGKNAVIKPGKVVVVDLWATTCLPCRREFPHLIELQKKYPDDVVAVSVSADYLGEEDRPPEFYFERALKFLKEKEARIDNYLLEDPQPEFFQQIQLNSLPAVYVYDQTGILRARFDNDENSYGEDGFSYHDDITPLVETLLEAGRNPTTVMPAN